MYYPTVDRHEEDRTVVKLTEAEKLKKALSREKLLLFVAEYSGE